MKVISDYSVQDLSMDLIFSGATPEQAIMHAELIVSGKNKIIKSTGVNAGSMKEIKTVQDGVIFHDGVIVPVEFFASVAVTQGYSYKETQTKSTITFYKKNGFNIEESNTVPVWDYDEIDYLIEKYL